MVFVLALKLFESHEERFGVFRRQRVLLQPRDEQMLIGNMSGTLPDMPSEHLDDGFSTAHAANIADDSVRCCPFLSHYSLRR